MSEIIYNKTENSEIHVIDKNHFKLDHISFLKGVKTHCLDDSNKWKKFIMLKKISLIMFLN